MRINHITHSNGFKAFVNGFSFLMMLVCFAATILLPLPYRREEPGGISLEPNPHKAPPIIALAVLVPFLCGVIFYLLYRLTYKKTKAEVLQELDENVEFNFITNETKYAWELELEAHSHSKKERRLEVELKRKENYLKMKQRELELDQRIEAFEKGEREVEQETKEDFVV